jgi:ATP-dependent helicase HrpB
VVFDEFHERSIHTDLALALCLDLRRLRPDLALLAMSATMDAGRLTEFLASADAEGSGVPVPLIDCPGRPYPVAVEHRPLPGRGRLGEETAAAVLRCLSERTDGVASGADDVLVFLPGRREIEDAAAVLRGELGRGDTEVRTLHGSLSLAEQRDVLAPLAPGAAFPGGSSWRTNIAETSLTVPEWALSWIREWSGSSASTCPRGWTGWSWSGRANAPAISVRDGRGDWGPDAACASGAPADSSPRDTDPEILRTDVASLVRGLRPLGRRAPPTSAGSIRRRSSSWEASAALLRALGAWTRRAGLPPGGTHCPAWGCTRAWPRSLWRGSVRAERLSPVPAPRRSPTGTVPRCGTTRNSGGAGPPAGRGRKRPAGPGWKERVADLASDLSSRLGGGGQFRFSWNAGAEADVAPCFWRASRTGSRWRQESGTFRFPSGREVRGLRALAGKSGWWRLDAEAGERTGTARLDRPRVP